MVDARAGPSLKTTLKPKKVKTLSGNRIKSNQISKLQKNLKATNLMLTVQPQVPLQLSLPVTVTSQMMAQIQRWLLAPTEGLCFPF